VLVGRALRFSYVAVYVTTSSSSTEASEPRLRRGRSTLDGDIKLRYGQSRVAIGVSASMVD
jgi:hypothetical protein